MMKIKMKMKMQEAKETKVYMDVAVVRGRDNALSGPLYSPAFAAVGVCVC